MGEEFYFLGYDIQKIKSNSYFCIYVLNLQKKVVLKIYKKYEEDKMYLYDNFSIFENVSDRISFNIRRNGKLALDINIL